MLIGSGIKGLGGTALVYTSNRVDGGWQFRGTLCEGNAAETGFVWECPLIVPLTTDAAGEDAADASGLLPAAPGLPATLFIHPDGTLAASHLGEISRESLSEQISRIATPLAEKDI